MRLALKVVRDLGDVLHCNDSRGRLIRIEMANCRRCERRKQKSQLAGDGLCMGCHEELRAVKAEKISAAADARRFARFRVLGTSAAIRQALLIKATPKWRDKKAIAAVYREAKRLTQETGIVHHVDHFYPVMGELCCGLHVHQNLRVLPASENCSKSNDHPMHDSPALFDLTNAERRSLSDMVLGFDRVQPA